MAKKLYKYEDVDIVTFLEEKMRENTESYQGDFEYDKQKFAKCVESDRKEDKILLWLSRKYGTQCVKEFDAFLEGTEGYYTWQYYANQEAGYKYVAFAVELKGVQDGVIRGNLYELDYIAHAAMVKKEAQSAYEVIKTFEDGFVAQAPLERSSYGYWAGLVVEHGPVVDTLGVPADKTMLSLVLGEQRRTREKLKEATWEPVNVQDILKDAERRSEVFAGARDSKEQEFGVGL